MKIDFKETLVEAYLYAVNNPDWKSLLASYFVREAKMALDQYYEPSEFFQNLEKEIDEGIADIETQFNRRLTENDWVIDSIESGRGIIKNGEHVTDKHLLKEDLDKLIKDREWIEQNGFRRNDWYKYRIYHTGNRCINLKYTDLELIRLAIRMAKDNLDERSKRPQIDNSKKVFYFTQPFNEEEKDKLFRGMIKHGFLPKNTQFSHFCFVFGGKDVPNEEKPFKPLFWLGTLKELNVFVRTYLSDEINQWEKTVKCFSKNGKDINIRSLTTAYDKYDNEPESSYIISNLLS